MKQKLKILEIKEDEVPKTLMQISEMERSIIRHKAESLLMDLAPYDLDVNLYNLSHLKNIYRYLTDNKNSILYIMVVSKK